jgi:hypothetical protein
LGYRIGSGYLGSSQIETSVANQEIVPSPPVNWTLSFALYKFSFVNRESCHVVINNGNSIFLDANQGFDMAEIDVPIRSFKVVEAGINFNWLGAY